MTEMETSSARHGAGSETRPAGIARGPGHVVVYGNAAFRSAFGDGAVGLPARESMLGLPSSAFAMLDLVFAQGRPLASWIRRDGELWRLTAVPRRDVETGDVYGLAFHLRARNDLPVVADDEERSA